MGATPQRRFLEAYSGQSLDELISLETNYRVDSLVLAIEQALLGRSELNEYERIVLAVEALEREVNNGGFDQFFTNSSNEFAPILAESLRRIGCPKTASIAQRAVDAAVDEEDEAREEHCPSVIQPTLLAKRSQSPTNFSRSSSRIANSYALASDAP